MLPEKRIPLTVIGGFLGAGKTTLLHRILRQAQGRRLAILVNDFGSLNIDASLVAARGADAIALSNGCVCCTIGDDLSAALMRVLDAEPAFDGVVIEASGVSDPWRIAQVGMVDPGLGLGGVIVLVDASAVLDLAADPLLADSLKRQVEAADWILINKTDLVDREQVVRVQRWIDQQVPGIPSFHTRQAELPGGLLTALIGDPQDAAAAAFDRADRHLREGTCPAHDPGQAHQHASGGGECADATDHGALFETQSWRPAGVLSATCLRAMLRAMPAGVLRLKGIVRTDSHGWAELQFAGRHGSLRKALRADDRDAAVVAIGLRGRLPGAALDAVFGPCSNAAPHGRRYSQTGDSRCVADGKP